MSDRVARVAEQLRERELEALVVTELVNVRYLTGFTGTNGAAIVAPQRRTFLTDFRYLSQSAEQVPDWEREIWAGNVKEFTLKNTSIDQVVFGVKSVDKEGHESPVSAYVLVPRAR